MLLLKRCQKGKQRYKHHAAAGTEQAVYRTGECACSNKSEIFVSAQKNTSRSSFSREAVFIHN